jgi:hypothetical protein
MIMLSALEFQPMGYRQGLPSAWCRQLRPFIGLSYQPWIIDGDDCAAIGGMNEWQKKPRNSEKTGKCTAQDTSDPSRLDPGRRGGKPQTSRLSDSTLIQC